MEELKRNENENITILVKDDNEYGIYSVPNDAGESLELAYIKFQNGNVKEVGVNGCQVEDLLNIVIEKIESLKRISMSP